MTKKLLIIFILIIIPLITNGCGKEEDNNINTANTDISQQNNNITDIIIQPPPTQIQQSSCQEEQSLVANLNQEITSVNCQYGNRATIIISREGASDLLVSVKLSSGNLFSYGFYFAYDPSVYQFASYEPTLAMGNEGKTLATAIETSSTEGAAGIVFSKCNARPDKRVLIVSHSRVGYDTNSISTNGVVGIIRFKIKTKMASEFIFSETTTITRNGVSSPTTQENHCWPQKLLAII